jgi:hypothetical protein
MDGDIMNKEFWMNPPNLNKKDLTPGHYLELIDRLHVIMCNIQEHCIEHPVAEKHKDLQFKLEYALGQLWDAYQEVGKLDHENNYPTCVNVAITDGIDG